MAGLWNWDRRSAQGERMRGRMTTPAMREAVATRRPARLSEQELANRSARMKALNERMRTDAELKARNLAAATAAKNRPEYLAHQAEVMRVRMQRPELREAARQHLRTINKNKAVKAKQWATRRRRAKESANE